MNSTADDKEERALTALARMCDQEEADAAATLKTARQQQQQRLLSAEVPAGDHDTVQYDVRLYDGHRCVYCGVSWLIAACVGVYGAWSVQQQDVRLCVCCAWSEQQVDKLFLLPW
jgi:hypothetical protein